MRSVNLKFRDSSRERLKAFLLIGTVGLIASLLFLAMRLAGFQNEDGGAFASLSPHDGSVVFIGNEIQFSWKPSERFKKMADKGGMRYELYVGNSPDSIKKLESDLYETSYTVSVSRLIFDLFGSVLVDSGRQMYLGLTELQVYWKVGMVVPNGKSYYSKLQKFVAKINKKPVVRVLHPSDFDVTIPITTLSWTCEDEEPDRVEFHVFLGSDERDLKQMNVPIEMVDEKTFVAKLTDAIVLKPAQVYFWKIVARDVHGETYETRPLRFRVSGVEVQKIDLAKYSKALGEIVHAGPLVGKDGKVYVGTLSGKLYVVNRNGSIDRAFDLKSGIWGSPLFINDKEVVVATMDGTLHLIRDDEVKNILALPGEIRASPAALGEHLYVATVAGELYAITRQNENWKVDWSFRTGGEIWSSPAVDGRGNIYFGSFDGNLYCVSPKGRLRWKFPTGGKIWSSPAIGRDGTVYFGSDDGFVYAVTDSGKLKWRFMTPSYIRSSPAICSDGTVIIGGWDNYVYAFKPSGELRWRVKLGASVFGGALIDNFGTVYVGSWDGCLYAITKHGEILWRVNLKHRIDSSPTIGSDGFVYFGCDDGNLYRVAPYGTLNGVGGTDRVAVSLCESPWPKFRGNVANTGVANLPK